MIVTDLINPKITSFVVKQCRRFKLLPHEKMTVLSRWDELQIVQYCLACYNKKEGLEFEADPSVTSKLIGIINSSRIACLENILKKFNNKKEIKDSCGCADALLGPICNKENKDYPGNINEDELDDDSVTAEKTLIISGLYEEYKNTSNHCSILDMYSRFLTAALNQTSDLHKDLTRNEEINKLTCDAGEYQALQLLQIQIIDLLRNIAKSSAAPSSQENHSLCSDNNVDPSSRETPTVSEICGADEIRLSPKTPKASKLGSGDSPRTPFSQSDRKEIQLAFVKDIFCSYLHLLVNARSQLALARVFNIPERGLDHKSFTHLKHEASTCGLSMYQTLSSFMLRLQLGGKGYAPSTNSPLLDYVKGLGSLLDLIQKLQTIIEEVPEVRASCRKVVNVIKINLIQCKSGKFPRSLVEPVCEKIHQTLASVIEDMEGKSGNSPLRAVGSGGSILGRQSLCMISHFLDTTALAVTHADYQLTADVRFSNQTPARFPCLLTQFRSPAIMDESEEENEDNIEEKNDRISSLGLCKSNKYFVSSALHIEPPNKDDLMLTQGTLNTIEILPSKTIVHPRADWGTKVQANVDKTKVTDSCTRTTLSTKLDRLESSKVSKKKGNKRCATTSVDKENLIASPGPVLTKAKKTKNCLTEGTPKSSKQVCDEGDKKCKSKNTNKSCRRRLMPQVKGQAKITGFFRM